MECYQTTLESLVAGAVSAGTIVTMSRLESALLEGKGFSSAQALELPALLRSLAEAADAGVDAIAIGNGFDPGLWEARELLDIPVLGYFETVAFYALRLGWRLGVLCSGTSGVARTEELATRYGIIGRMVPSAAVGITVPMIMAGFTDSDAGTRIVEGCEGGIEMLRQRGAEVVMIASGALDVFLQTRGSVLTPVVPVVPGTVVLARELEAAAALRRLGVPAASRAGRFRRPPGSVQSKVRDA